MDSPSTKLSNGLFSEGLNRMEAQSFLNGSSPVLSPQNEYHALCSKVFLAAKQLGVTKADRYEVSTHWSSLWERLAVQLDVRKSDQFYRKVMFLAATVLFGLDVGSVFLTLVIAEKGRQVILEMAQSFQKWMEKASRVFSEEWKRDVKQELNYFLNSVAGHVTLIVVRVFFEMAVLALGLSLCWSFFTPSPLAIRWIGRLLILLMGAGYAQENLGLLMGEFRKVNKELASEQLMNLMNQYEIGERRKKLELTDNRCTILQDQVLIPFRTPCDHIFDGFALLDQVKHGGTSCSNCRGNFQMEQLHLDQERFRQIQEALQSQVK